MKATTSMGLPNRNRTLCSGVKRMNTMKMAFVAALAAVLLGGCNDDDVSAGVSSSSSSSSSSAPAPSTSSNAVILEWNRLLTENQGAGNLFSFRQYAMLHVAMFDAVNSVTKQYRPYRLEVLTGTAGSEEAAAAQAGHDVMVALYPAATASFDTALTTRLAALPQTAAAQGVDIGRQVAAAIVQWRTGDGSASADPVYVPPALPGLWRPTAAGQVATGGRMLTMLPFALLSPTQYLPAPPPPLDSAQYAANFAQVRDVGRWTAWCVPPSRRSSRGLWPA